MVDKMFKSHDKTDPNQPQQIPNSWDTSLHRVYLFGLIAYLPVLLFSVSIVLQAFPHVTKIF